MIVRPQFQTVADFFQDALRLQWLPSIPSQSCRLLHHVTDYLLDIRLRAGAASRPRADGEDRRTRRHPVRPGRRGAWRGKAHRSNRSQASWLSLPLRNETASAGRPRRFPPQMFFPAGQAIGLSTRPRHPDSPPSWRKRPLDQSRFKGGAVSRHADPRPARPKKRAASRTLPFWLAWWS